MAAGQVDRTDESACYQACCILGHRVLPCNRVGQNYIRSSAAFRAPRSPCRSVRATAQDDRGLAHADGIAWRLPFPAVRERLRLRRRQSLAARSAHSLVDEALEAPAVEILANIDVAF